MMQCPKCGYEQEKGLSECAGCGIYFLRYQQSLARKAKETKSRLVGIMWLMPDAANPLYNSGRLLILVVLIWLSWSLILSPIDYWQGNAASRSFLSFINLPFHESGHAIFSPFGDFIHSLGGTLGQLMMPTICGAVLLWKTNDAFGAAVSLWWLGENFLDTVSYINDAIALTMPLLGGNQGITSPYGFHDWEFLLTESGVVKHAHEIAKTVHIIGSILILFALIWMFLLLRYKRIKTNNESNYERLKKLRKNR